MGTVFEDWEGGNEMNRTDSQFVDADLYRDVIGRFASGVTVITARHDSVDYGLTASAVTSLSMEPPTLLVCVNADTGTNMAITESQAFAVNILDEDQGGLAAQFAQPHQDKFREVGVGYGSLGEPVLEDVLAHLECRVAETVQSGTHSVFIAEVCHAEAREGTPLAYFRGKFGRFAEAADEQVYTQIRRRVLDRDMPLGHPLDISELAYQLDVPQQSVYYALAKLGAEGLVSRSEDSYVITPVETKGMVEALDARGAIEALAAERSVGRLSDEQIAELRRRMEATKNLVAEDRFTDLDVYVEANASFHEYLVELSGNDTLLESYRGISAETIMWRTLQESMEASDAWIDEHERIVSAYEASDIREAKRMIEEHTERAKSVGRHAIDSVGGRV